MNNASVGASSSQSSEDASLSSSITRQKGIAADTEALEPAELLKVLDACLRAMSTQGTSDNMQRRIIIIAAHMEKLIKV